jgi:hypothetical protein
VVKYGQIAFCGIKTVVEFEGHDGWTDIVCPTNYLWHQTVASYRPHGSPFGRFGCSMQTNNKLQKASVKVNQYGGVTRDVQTTAERFIPDYQRQGSSRDRY